MTRRLYRYILTRTGDHIDIPEFLEGQVIQIKPIDDIKDVVNPRYEVWIQVPQ